MIDLKLFPPIRLPGTHLLAKNTAEEAENNYDLEKAAKLQHATIPQLEKELQQLENSERRRKAVSCRLLLGFSWPASKHKRHWLTTCRNPT